MTRALNAVEGVRKALGQQSIENQPALILEYIFNFLFENKGWGCGLQWQIPDRKPLILQDFC